jgi:hypothetical protein
VSAGHHAKVSETHWREFQKIRARPWFQQGVAIPKTLIRKNDVPWLAGSSADLKRIYIDPRFRGTGRFGKAFVLVGKFIPGIVRHEIVEGILLVLGRDEKGQRYEYDGAHEIATAAELRVAKIIAQKLGLNWSVTAYQDMFAPFLKAMQSPPWTNLPLDLNLTPYRDDTPVLYREIEKQILRQQLARTA